ncbi:MAG: cell surface protein, partial [Muribaculaceae bacterium]|nr:cell surface protein [Muribaculaceae bacterium]
MRFPSQSYIRRSTTRYTFVGRKVILEPEVSDFISPSFAWTVDGEEVECDKQKFEFTPLASGNYIISVAVSETSDIAAVPCRMSRNLFRSSSSSARAFVEVVCVDGSETDLRRYPGAGASAYSDKVYEWIPAPGQFINLATMGGAELSHESACVWAQNRLDAGIDVSLGAFGGYIVVGFDHSIVASAGYDFAIVGNAFVGENGAQCSNEPGVVWVMQDVNGNGLPDDEWYELKGSEYDMESTVHGYAVTYYRPEASGMDVRWSDNIGNSGTIDYLAAFHNQPYYYPMWIDSGSYTLSGTSLKARNYFDTAIGVWTTLPYGWGYADNVGSDAITGVQGQQTGFKISNAVFADGTPIDLQYIDFIKVQGAVQAKSG